MNDLNIANLYRRMTARGARRDVLDADAVLAVSEGGLVTADRSAAVAALAESPAEASLVRMLRELRVDSELLATRLQRECGRRTRQAVHPRRSATVRHAPAMRRHAMHARIGRWSALAACLVAVLGLWSWQHTADIRDATLTRQASEDRALSDQLAASRDLVAARGDIIFTTRDDIFGAGMEPRGTAAQTGDRLFRAGFNGS